MKTANKRKARGRRGLLVEAQVVQLAVHVDGVGLRQVDQLLDGFIDEDNANQRGKGLLGEAGDVADEGAGIGGHQDDTQEGRPQPNASPQGEVRKGVVPEKYQGS